MSHTFKITWANGARRYYHRRAAAVHVYFQANEHPDTKAEERPESCSKVMLSDDAFERAANGTNGYELQEEVLHSRLPKGPKLVGEELCCSICSGQHKDGDCLK